MPLIRNTNSNRSNLIVRATGIAAFVATVGFFLYIYYAGEPLKSSDDGRLVTLMLAFTPIPMVGFLGLAIGWYGEEPNILVRRYLRKRGLFICLIGIGEMILGSIILYVFAILAEGAELSPDLIGVLFTSLASVLVLGLVTVIYGLLTCITGRNPKSVGWRGTLIERLEKEHGGQPRIHES